MGENWEVIQFIVVATITKSIIVGLELLDKWGPMIWWEGGYRKLRIGVTPRPPPHVEAQGVDQRGVPGGLQGRAVPQVYVCPAARERGPLPIKHPGKRKLSALTLQQTHFTHIH